MMRPLLLALALTSPAWAEETQQAAAAHAEAPQPASTLSKNETARAETSGVKETVCTQDSRVRKVTLSTDDEGSACKVFYIKETEMPGVEKVLWSAKQKSDYCQEQATAFVEKLKGWGWSCQ